MKEILSYILKNILPKEAEFQVEEEYTDGIVNLKITAPKEYVGRIIGKEGRIINSIKNLLKIKAIKEEKRLDIQVVEN